MTDIDSPLLSPDRCFGPDARQLAIARELYSQVAAMPLVCPHSHVEPRVLADPNYSFGSPVELIIMPDHYVYRMLYSKGVPLEALGISGHSSAPVERDHRRIWQTFADHWHLFRATPTSLWLNYQLHIVFGIAEKFTPSSAQRIYDRIAECLATPEFRPRALYQRFNIAVLATTDSATDTLEHHDALRVSGWPGQMIPTFRPDGLLSIDTPNWRANIAKLEECVGFAINNFNAFVRALEVRRTAFKAQGAVATDHAALTPYAEILSASEAEALFQRALRSSATPTDATRFTGHMLVEMARMSVEDGLVMQLHAGSLRNHNVGLYQQFGPDRGADIPVAVEFTQNLRPLLNRFGSDPRLTLILFTLDESTYSRELAPLAGHYPAVRLGPPWWFLDSLNGMQRYFDQVIETAGLYNTAGFNDDTRAFLSIPARHDLWRRAAANWLAGLVVRGVVDTYDATEMMHDCAYRLALQAYRLPGLSPQLG
ncbi:MAG: glucuronate isomerase [Aggregatilineales bacterium]